MSEREIQLYNRKGIFTVRQLSYTFRFRKRSKRVKARGRPHSFPLQALALREHSVFIVSKPAVPEASTQIYVDMEGNPSGSFVYLIGVRIADNGGTSHQAFWADRREDEAHLFQQFLHYLSHCKRCPSVLLRQLKPMCSGGCSPRGHLTRAVRGC